MRSRWKADQLRLELARRGLTGREFGRLVGVTEETVSRLLQGRPTTPKTTKAIITVLATTPLMERADLIETAK
jgi:transcriptional regulator with XRE-family HTH domain